MSCVLGFLVFLGINHRVLWFDILDLELDINNFYNNLGYAFFLNVFFIVVLLNKVG